MFMKSLISVFFVVPLLIAGCNKDNKNKEVIKIEGFVLTDNLGNRISIIGSAGNDWKILDWSQLSSKEQSFLNFSDTVDLNNTVVSTLNDPIAFPNPFSSYSYIEFHSTDSVKVKLAIVNSSGQVLKTFAMKVKGYRPVVFDFSNDNLFPGGMSLRYYYSYSAASQQNFKAGYGDVKICKPLVFPVTSCF